jgi:hypothetical protein
LLHFEIHGFDGAGRRVVLILAGYLSLLSAAVEAPALRPLGAAVPTSSEILHAAEEAMGTEKARAGIHSISAVAACHGPKGDYETRVISDRSGNLSFQQFFPNHKNIEGILEGRGWQLGDDGRYEWVDAIEISVLRGHEFQVMALDLRKRFRDFKTIGQAEFEGQATMQIDMTDDLGHSASGYFSSTSHLPVGLMVTDARSRAPRTITLRFDAWKFVGGVNLVNHVTIVSGSETWIFDFKALQVNTADKAAFQIPETPTRSSERR